jgi:hypothetical protein
MCWLLHKIADHFPSFESMAAWMTKVDVSMACLQAIRALNNFPSKRTLVTECWGNWKAQSSDV